MKKFEKLSRAEMKNVLGGVAEPHVTSCTADCGLGTSVTCSGWTCQATDYEGCSSASDSNGQSGPVGQNKSCNSVIYF
jgi:hypothetical protein